MFDFVEGFVDKASNIIDRTRGIEARQSERREPRNQKRVDTAPTVKTTAVALRRSPRFHIDELIAAETGQPIFVVTDGGNARAECTTRALAEKILAALEAAP